MESHSLIVEGVGNWRKLYKVFTDTMEVYWTTLITETTKKNYSVKLRGYKLHLLISLSPLSYSGGKLTNKSESPQLFRRQVDWWEPSVMLSDKEIWQLVLMDIKFYPTFQLISFFFSLMIHVIVKKNLKNALQSKVCLTISFSLE